MRQTVLTALKLIRVELGYVARQILDLEHQEEGSLRPNGATRRVMDRP